MTDLDDAHERLAALLRAQGAVFVRELFRQQQLPVSGSKAELEQRAHQALDDGEVTPDLLLGWIAQVEGWGRERVQLRYLQEDELEDLGSIDDAGLQDALDGSGFAQLVGQLDTDTFPDELTPTGAILADGKVRLTWHVRADREVRAADSDFEQTIDGDLYRFKAFRVAPERHTVRLVLEQGSGVCGLFLSVPKNAAVELDPVVEEAWDLARRICGTEAAPIDLDRAIKNLSEGGDASIAARRRRMEASGARVSFETTAAADYRQSPQVSQVAQSASAVAGFSNRLGDFHHTAAGQPQAPDRNVTVKIDQQEGSLWVPAQVTADQMWNLVRLVVDASLA